MARTIQSPGVEINEIDLTLRPLTQEGTSVFITGFSNQGPIDEVLQPTSISEFEQIYGAPTNDAERYFYHSVRSVLNTSPAKVLVSRLPYGDGRGEGFDSWKYSALVYPVEAKRLQFFILSSYNVNSVFVSNSGAGYAKLPQVRAIGGEGDNLTVIAALTANDGRGTNTCGITGFTITNKGTFQTIPTVSITTSFVNESIFVSNSGSGYIWDGNPANLPVINLITKSGETRVIQAQAVSDLLADDKVGQFNLTNIVITNSAQTLNQNGGYSSRPDVITINGNPTTMATLEAQMGYYNPTTNTSTVTSVRIVDAGFGYTQTPTLCFLGGGKNASSTIPNPTFLIYGNTTKTYGITGVNLTNIGSGYDNPPDVQIVGTRIGINPAEIEVEGTYFNALGLVDGSQRIDHLWTNNIVVGDENSNEYNTPLADDGKDPFDIPDSYNSQYYGKTCFIGKPTHVELTLEQYEDVLNGNVNWSNYPNVSSQAFNYDNIGESAFIILNKAQSTINNKFEGYYIGLLDNSNYNPATDFDGITRVESLQKEAEVVSSKDFTIVPNSRLSFTLSADQFGSGNSISEVMENLSNYDLADKSFDDTFALGVFKLRQDLYTDSTSLAYNLVESYVGSINYNRTVNSSDGGRPIPFSMEKVTEGSNSFKLLMNPYLSDRYNEVSPLTNSRLSKRIRILGTQLETPYSKKGFVDTIDTYTTRSGAVSTVTETLGREYGRTDALFPLGIYSNSLVMNKNIGSLPQKLDRAFELVENSDVYPIDIAIEGGLGTIYVNSLEQSNTDGLSAGEYSANTSLKGISSFYITNFEGLNGAGLDLRSNYSSIANIFINVAEKQRKDFLVILDPIKNIFVQGDNNKVINTKKIWSPNAGIEPNLNAPNYVSTNFSQHIYWPLRHQFGTINCSYATTYSTWAQVVDPFTNRQIWIPFSGIAASLMANTDSNFQPWYAPAGFTRGVVTGVNDLGVYPKQKQRDQLYKISINPVAFFPNEGFVVFGQKTLLKKPSAFDRINVRRLFLNLETATKNTAKFFVFEPNTLFTRTQVVNVLTPIFENAKNTEGLYDYRIVCSELNNTPDVIDNNELKVDIYIQPVRTAEFILVNFIATRTGANFDELIGG